MSLHRDDRSPSDRGSTTLDDREQVEDEEALHHQAQLRGLPYDTMICREDSSISADNVFCVAPGEGQKPIPILADQNLKQCAIPPSTLPASLVFWQTGIRILVSANISTSDFWMLMADSART